MGGPYEHAEDARRANPPPNELYDRNDLWTYASCLTHLAIVRIKRPKQQQGEEKTEDEE